MTPDEVGVAVRAFLGIAAGLLILRFALAPTLTEVFRQRMFRLRRKLVCLRLDGVVASDEPAYVKLYRRMNMLIRRAESLTFGRLLMGVVVPPPKLLVEEQVFRDLEIALEQASPEAREPLQKLYADLGYEVVRHVLITSPLGWVFFAATFPLVMLAVFFTMTRKRVVATLRDIGQRPLVKRLEIDPGMLHHDDGAQPA
jgi:hypothetical protein